MLQGASNVACLVSCCSRASCCIGAGTRLSTWSLTMCFNLCNDRIITWSVQGKQRWRDSRGVDPTTLLLALLLALLCALLQAINLNAKLIECTNVVVNLEKVLGISAFSMDRLLEMDPDFLVRNLHCLFRIVHKGNAACMHAQPASIHKNPTLDYRHESHYR